MGKAKKVIYLDNAATTRVSEKVVSEMKKYLIEKYGNPSSAHELGERAREAIDSARKKIAAEIGAKAHEIVFTSGATEANNMALFGIARAGKEKGKNKIIISSIEHASISEICDALKKEGFEVVEVGVNNEGFVDLLELETKIDDKTALVSIIHGNNEIGVLQDLKRIGEICKAKEVLFHSDAVQSFGKEFLNVGGFGLSLLSASGHKIGGPKGIGFLYVRDGIEIKPLIYGGGQERGLRGGTENVPAIIGFAKALELVKKVDKEKIKELRDYFISELEKIGGKINGSKVKRLCNNVSVCFSGLNAEDAVIKLSLKGVMCSTGSACETRGKKEKRVLRAIGLNERGIKGTLRFTLNRDITKRDMDFVLNELTKVLKAKKL